MEDFSHDCDKTLHLIPCPVCKYNVRFPIEGYCSRRRHQRKCYVCDICDHCKKAHDQQLHIFLNIRQKELNEQKHYEDPLKGDILGLLREFFKSLVPNPRKTPKKVPIDPIVPIQAEEKPDSNKMRFESISESFTKDWTDLIQHVTKKTRSLGDPTVQKKLDNITKEKNSVNERHGKKIFKSGAKEDVGDKQVIKDDTDLNKYGARKTLSLSELNVQKKMDDLTQKINRYKEQQEKMVKSGAKEEVGDKQTAPNKHGTKKTLSLGDLTVQNKKDDLTQKTHRYKAKQKKKIIKSDQSTNKNDIRDKGEPWKENVPLADESTDKTDVKQGLKPKSARKPGSTTARSRKTPENLKDIKHLPSVASIPNTHKLTLNLCDDYRTRPQKSKIMLDIHSGAPGVISYALSNPKFIDNGYTKLPTLKVMRKLLRFEMKPVVPKLDWFALNKSKGFLYYDKGEPFAKFKGDHYQLFYRNGDLALDHYGCEERNVKFRTVTYDTDLCFSMKEPAKKPIILATFDDMGNGIVYDSKGNVRLEYNQSEGVIYDKTVGTPSRWKWHNLNEPPELREMLVDTGLPQKDKNLTELINIHENSPKQQPELRELIREQNKEEVDSVVKEGFRKLLRKKKMDFKQYEVQMKAVKLNDFFSLHINRQSAIMLQFQDGPVNLKLNVGLVIQSGRIVDVEYVEIGNFMNPMEQVPARSDSLSSMQKVVRAARGGAVAQNNNASPMS